MSNLVELSRRVSEAEGPSADYWLDNYGTCTIAPCTCLKDGWLGRRCGNWKPLGVRSLAALLAIHERNNNDDKV